AVVFAGAVSEPFRSFGDATIYVQPSRREVLPLAVMEAMAAGLPVVATTVGGLDELIDDGKSGRLVPPDDARALAGAVEELLACPPQAAALARAGSARMRRAYTVEAMVDEWLELYARL
ncbi:MAG: glycosyltransferase, partial [Acidimicrobiales bacterium]